MTDQSNKPELETAAEGINQTRRNFLRQTAAVTAGATIGGAALTGCSPSVGKSPQSPIKVDPNGPSPWINWAGNLYCQPQNRFSPSNEDELASILKNAKGEVRPVGASHSFSPVVPTDDTLIATDLLQGLVSHNAELNQATFWAGTRIQQAGPMLEGIGQAFVNLPDMDYPSLAGALATSVHGTGIHHGSMSDTVVDLTLVTPQGEVLECSPNKNPEVFEAAKVSLGALGVMSKVTLQNEPSYNLTEVSGIAETEDILNNIDELFEKNRQFEFFPLPLTDYSLTVTTNIAQEGDVNAGLEDPESVNIIKTIHGLTSWMPASQAIYNALAGFGLKMEADALVRTGPSYQVLAHDRVVRFREMEYTVPAEHGPACLREILAKVKKHNLPLPFPIEYRHVRGDKQWMSMFEGGDGASLSIHQFGDWEYEKVFAEIEPIFWKYNGRPHWGKLHTLGSKELKPLYRHWDQYQEVRRELDPTGKMLNKHLRYALT